MKNLIGKTINQYQVLLKVRETGTRVLFKIYDTNTKQNLALEVIKVENIDYAELFDLLRKRAIQNAKLTQSNIAIMIDSGIFEDIPYFVYNFSPFQPLRRLFNQKFSWQDSARDLVAITQAMAYAHEHSVVHGFLNPENIILDEHKNPYLFDFGFEKIILNYVVTRLPGSWINSSDYAYCSPEQLIGDSIDARSDVYAMGLILYEWMTGELPFLEETALATLYKRKILPGKALDLKTINIPAIEQMVEKCIATDPKDRYQSMQELSVLLARGALEIKITPKMADKPLSTPVVASPNRTSWRIRFVSLGILIVSIAAVLWLANGAGLKLSVVPPSSTVVARVTKQKVVAIATSTAIPTPIATQTIEPTQVPNKIDYPVLEGTALPLSLQKISPENSARLITLSRWGIGELNRLVVSPDGILFAAASPVGVFLYQSDGFTLQKYLDTSSWVSALKFSSDGKKLAAGDRDGLIIVWDTTSWNQVGNHSGNKAGILDLAFSPDGAELASIAADGTLIKWNASGDPVLKSVKGVTSLVYSQDGSEIITGGDDFKVNFWNTTDLSLLKTLTHSSKITAIKINNADKTLVIGGSDRSVTLIDPNTGEKLRSLTGLQNVLSSVAISPNGLEIVASDIYGGIVAWGTNGTLLWSVPTRVDGFIPSDNVLGVNHSVEFSVDGKTIISGLRNGTIRLYDAAAGGLIEQNDSLNNRAQKLVISHNGNFVLSQGNDKVKMRDVRSGKILFQVAGTMKQGSIFSLNDDYFAVAANASTVKVFKTTSGDEVFSFNGLQNIQVIQFIQNDRFLVAGSDPLLRIWSMTSAQEIKTNNDLNGTGCTAVNNLKAVSLFIFTKYNYVPQENNQSPLCSFQKADWMKALSINEINSDIAFGGNSKLGYMDSKGSYFEMEGVNHLVIQKVAINADNSLLAVALNDNTIGVWDTATKQQVMQLYGPDNSITDLQFTPNGVFLLSSSLDGTIRVWGIP